MHFSYEMSILLFLAFAGFFIANRLRQPTAVVNILLGILIGPTLLQIIQYNTTVQTVAYLGAIFQIFIAGLEYKSHNIYTIKNILIALGGSIFPWIVGYFVSTFFFNSIHSIFIATTMTATSIAVSVAILKELGLLQRKMSNIIIGAALVDDILGLLMLSITKSYLVSQDLLPVFLTKAGFSTLFLVIAMLLGPYISRIASRIHSWAKVQKIHYLAYLFAITIAFLYGALAELVGLSAIVGAFLAGFVLEKLNYQDFKVGAQYVGVIFSSIFFISLGILVSVKFTESIVRLVLILTLVAVVSKIIGSTLLALITKVKAKEAIIIGVAMVPRGEVAMVTALIGLNMGIITQEIYSTLIIMAVLTCLVTPTLLKLTLRLVRRKQTT